MRQPSFHELGGVLAAPSTRARRLAFAAVAAVVLAVALAAAGVVIAILPPAPNRLLTTLSGPHGQKEVSAAFSPDGKTLAVASSSDPPEAPSSISLWDVATRRWTATLPGSSCAGRSPVVYSPDGKTLALFGSGNTTCLWNLATRQETTLTDPSSSEWTGGAFSPDGATLAVADDNGNIYLWSLATRRVTATLTYPGNCGGFAEVAFSPDGSLLAGLTDCGPAKTYIWDLATRHVTGTLTDPVNTGANMIQGGDSYVPDSLAFGRDGMLAVADGNGTVYVWDVATRKVAAITPPFNQAQMQAAYADLPPGEEGPDPYPASWTSTWAVFSPDGKILAVNADYGYGTYLYDVSTGKLVATLTNPDNATDPDPTVVFSPGGSMMAVVEINGCTYLWHVG
jgi:WD40 repeat protein